MTAHTQIRARKQRTTYNQKDGATGRRSNSWGGKTEPVFSAAQMESYTWPGNFPVFRISPGRIDNKSGLIARHEQSGTVEWFQLNVSRKDIEARLDDLIIEIVRYDADIDEEIDIDAFMTNGEDALWVSPPEIDVDLNDTIMDNKASIVTWSNGAIKPDDICQWDTPLGDKMGIADSQFITWAYKTPDLQLSASPHDGAKNTLEVLKSQGYKINIVTATCMSEEQVTDWLNFHNIPFDTIKLTKDKTGSNPLIDDSPTTIAKRQEAGLPTIIFDQLWNRHIPGPRIANWSELPRMLKQKCVYGRCKYSPTCAQSGVSCLGEN